jgi:Helicase HerA, central domain
MGWLANAIVFLFAVWALGAGSLIVGIPLLLYLLYRLSKRGGQKKANGGTHSRWTAWLGLFLIFLSFVAALAHGTYSPLAFGLAGIIVIAGGLFPSAILGAARRVAYLVYAPLLLHFGRPAGSEAAASVELTRLPLAHLEGKKSDPREKLLRFQRMAQTLGELGDPVEFRLDFAEGRGRILFSVFGSDAKERLPVLLQVVKAQLPEFGAGPGELPDMEDSFTVSVEGVPEPSADPIGPLARFFVENRLGGAYSVTIAPAQVSRLSRWLAGREQRRLARDSATQATVQRADSSTSTTVVDHRKQTELEESVKRLERASARKPVRVSVRVSAEDESVAIHAANVLAGALSSHRRVGGLKVGRPLAPGKAGLPVSTLMLPSEATPYLWLPQVSMGMSVAPSAEFQAPPRMEGEVVLGEVVTLSGRSGQQARVPLDQLAKHVFVTGMTGSGKTTSCFGLLIQLHRMGVPFLVVEPAKSEYRSLLACIPGLQVFTIGDEQTAPFRLNIFEPPPGVKVQAHLENLEAVWNASFVSYAPLPYVVKQVFAEAYRACGWDVAGNVRGKAVTFEDVSLQVERVVRGLGYERDVTMNVEAALKTRLRSLSLGSKGALFEAESSTPLDAVLERPTVVELKDVQNDEEKAFVAALLMMNVAALAQARGASRHLRHFTLIEEAHRLLPNVSTEKGDPEAADPRRRMVESFGNMLAELRAYGEGLGVVEQIPTKILPDAIKNTATKVVHRVPAEDDRRVMAGAMNASEEQAAVFTALRPGEAVLSVEGHPVPVRVEVEDVAAPLGVAVGEVPDVVVKRKMESFYLKYPLPREPPASRDERVRRLVEEEQFEKEFVGTYRVWLKTGEIGPLRECLLRASRAIAKDEAEVMELAGGILGLATGYYLPFDARQRALFPKLFMKEVEKSVGRR